MTRQGRRKIVLKDCGRALVLILCTGLLAGCLRGQVVDGRYVAPDGGFSVPLQSPRGDVPYHFLESQITDQVQGRFQYVTFASPSGFRRVEAEHLSTHLSLEQQNVPTLEVIDAFYRNDFLPGIMKADEDAEVIIREFSDHRYGAQLFVVIRFPGRGGQWMTYEPGGRWERKQMDALRGFLFFVEQPYFFAVSAQLAGASPNAGAEPLDTPGPTPQQLEHLERAVFEYADHLRLHDLPDPELRPRP